VNLPHTLCLHGFDARKPFPAAALIFLRKKAAGKFARRFFAKVKLPFS